MTIFAVFLGVLKSILSECTCHLLCLQLPVRKYLIFHLSPFLAYVCTIQSSFLFKKPSSFCPILVFSYPACMCAQSCLTLCYPMDYSPPGSPVHGIFQARILEWIATSSSRGFLANRWGNNGNSYRIYFFVAPKSLQMLTVAMKLKDTCSLGEKNL